MKEKRKWGGVVRDSTVVGERKQIFGHEGPQAVPARPSGKSKREGKAFGSGEGREMRSGARSQHSRK
jgi:hypothetical protein